MSNHSNGEGLTSFEKSNFINKNGIVEKTDERGFNQDKGNEIKKVPAFIKPNISPQLTYQAPQDVGTGIKYPMPSVSAQKPLQFQPIQQKATTIPNMVPPPMSSMVMPQFALKNPMPSVQTLQAKNPEVPQITPTKMPTYTNIPMNSNIIQQRTIIPPHMPPPMASGNFFTNIPPPMPSIAQMNLAKKK